MREREPVNAPVFGKPLWIDPRETFFVEVPFPPVRCSRCGGELGPGEPIVLVDPRRRGDDIVCDVACRKCEP